VETGLKNANKVDNSLLNTRSLVALRFDHDEVTRETRCSSLVKMFNSSDKQTQQIVIITVNILFAPIDKSQRVN